MARHGKKRAMPDGAKTALIFLGILALLTALCLVTIHSGLLTIVAEVFAPTTVTTTTPSTTTTPTAATTTAPKEEPPRYAYPDEMKGVWLTAGTDYLKSENNTAAVVKQQIDAAFAAMEDWQFNTLLLPLHYKDKALYPSTLLDGVTLLQKDGTPFDVLGYILSCARAKQMYVYGIVDLHVRDKMLGDPRNGDERAAILANVKEQVSAYAMDGYFVSDFSYGLGQLEKNTDLPSVDAAVNALMSTTVKTVREYNRDLYLGLLSTGIWAHASVDERGSKTGEYYEEMTDGRADTLSWLKQGWFNCVLMQGDTSTNHPTAPFQNMLEWWGKTVGEIPLYVSHSANTIGSYKVGWKLTDQLAKQYLYCKGVNAWKGSAYDSLTALVSDKTGIADALKKAYAGTLNEAFLYNTLSVTNPTKTSFTTTSSTLKFEGGGDTNFPLTINGEEVALTEHGFFTQTYTLSVGSNKFVFSHKGITRTYEVIYKQTLLQSLSPSGDMHVDGGNMFVISAVARKGSSVKATLGGKTVALEEAPIKEDETGGAESDFATFSGTLTLPDGKIAEEQPLGAVSVTASYNGLTETKVGGNVVIAALPIPTTTTTATTTTTTVTTTTTTTTTTVTTLTTLLPGETATAAPSSMSTSVATETTTVPTTTTTRPEPTLPSGNTQSIVVITSDYAETFSGGAADDHSRPYNSLLPKGTWDYLSGKVYNGSLSYYTLASGKRVYMKDATVVNGGALPLSKLQNLSATLTATHTVFTLDSDWYVPMYIASYPHSS